MDEHETWQGRVGKRDNLTVKNVLIGLAWLSLPIFFVAFYVLQ